MSAVNVLKITVPTVLMSLYLKNKNQENVECNEGVMAVAKKAICILNSDGGSSAKGIVEIGQIQANRPVHIRGNFSGLNPNQLHGFHIHQWGNLTEGCSTAGPHYNPEKKNHGGPSDLERHIGDLGNVQADENGFAKYELVDSKITLYGIYSVVGRSLVLHNDTDDLGRGNFPDSKTTGHSGTRIACGVIGLTEFTKKDLDNYLF